MPLTEYIFFVVDTIKFHFIRRKTLSTLLRGKGATQTRMHRRRRRNIVTSSRLPPPRRREGRPRDDDDDDTSSSSRVRAFEDDDDDDDDDDEETSNTTRGGGQGSKSGRPMKKSSSCPNRYRRKTNWKVCYRKITCLNPVSDEELFNLFDAEKSTIDRRV